MADGEIFDANRRVRGHDFAIFARHEPTHSQTTQKIVNRVFVAVIRRGVVARQNQTMAATLDEKAFFLSRRCEARRNINFHRVGQFALADEN